MPQNFKTFFFLLIFTVSTLAAAKDKKDLAIASVFQNEARFLKEWIEYHKTVGVQHFYLFNNRSTDDFTSVLQPYVQNGEVELFDWPIKPKNIGEWNTIQCNAFNEALKKASKAKYKWIACIDTDEYIVPKKHNSLVEMLKDYEDFGALAINWQCFGHNNIQEVKPHQFLIELMTMRGIVTEGANIHIKCIVQPKAVKKYANPHFGVYKGGWQQVTTAKVPFQGPFSPSIDVSIAQINHYWTRDILYMETIKIPRREEWGDNGDSVRFIAGDLFNREEDLSIFPFLVKMKARLSQ